MAKKRSERSKAGNQVVSNKKAGRKYQRKMAIRLGGKSVGVIEGQDISHPVFSIECKKFNKLPAWLIGEGKKAKGDGLWRQCLRNCPKEKIPIALVHTTSSSHDDDIVIMRLEDFEKIVNPKGMINDKINIT